MRLALLIAAALLAVPGAALAASPPPAATGSGDIPDNQVFDNGFKVQWEMFLRHVAEDAPFPHDFLEGARGVQLAELGLQSWAERRWIDVPELS